MKKIISFLLLAFCLPIFSMNKKLTMADQQCIHMIEGLKATQIHSQSEIPNTSFIQQKKRPFSELCSDTDSLYRFKLDEFPFRSRTSPFVKIYTSYANHEYIPQTDSFACPHKTCTSIVKFTVGENKKQNEVNLSNAKRLMKRHLLEDHLLSRFKKNHIVDETLYDTNIAKCPIKNCQATKNFSFKYSYQRNLHIVNHLVLTSDIRYKPTTSQ